MKSNEQAKVDLYEYNNPVKREKTINGLLHMLLKPKLKKPKFASGGIRGDSSYPTNNEKEATSIYNISLKVN